MIDIVIPLGTGSLWKDNELRICLRSVQQNMEGVRNIYIVGVKPKWLSGVVWIKMTDLPGCRQFNIMRKVLTACKSEALSENFLFMNDDHYVMKKIHAMDIPYWYSGMLSWV